ncbi:pre-mRNA-splicing factor 38B [Bombina bombina]|uniref:pre-mRNA-splicing factor 38B n=1 Tax=Bombina bombina TaxID=8345 RepID=UPI00235AF150|nr:pre-mRNA-splicing factor 38B [Bombina bombina]
MANNSAAAALAGTPQPPQTGGGVSKPASSGKTGNVLPLWGNEKTMNLNPMILTNILSSPYFKVQLYELKTYHEVVDEIYFKVTHVEPWEKGSRKTAGQTGMCGGGKYKYVRGVGTGGIVSTAFCLLYKLFTLKLTRKQVMGLITHTDSPYIRALGFMYIRYTQPPTDLWDWYEDFLDDEEDLDVKAGGGCVMTIGEMLRSFLTKLEWFSTLFPRIPVPVQKHIDQQIKTRPRKVKKESAEEAEEVDRHAERRRSRTPKSPRRSPRRSRSRSHHRDHHGTTNFDRELEREKERQRLERETKDKRRSRSNDRRRSKSKDRHRTRSRSKDRKTDRRDRDREKENERSRKREHEKKGNGREKETDRTRDRSKERKRSEERRDRDDKRHREDRDSRKERRHSRSRSRDRKRKSKSPSRNASGRSRSREKSGRHKEKTNKKSRSTSRDRTDSSEKSRKRERSTSREKPRKRSRSKERTHRRNHDGKDHSSDVEEKQRGKDETL